jgi:hypothetical protein
LAIEFFKHPSYLLLDHEQRLAILHCLACSLNFGDRSGFVRFVSLRIFIASMMQIVTS